jgi:predicted HTH transcriptional regulator
VTVPIHERFLDLAVVKETRAKGARRTSSEIKDGILELLSERGCMSTKEICLAMGYSNVSRTMRRCINELLEEGKAAYLHPGSPTDSRQRICSVGRQE